MLSGPPARFAGKPHFSITSVFSNGRTLFWGRKNNSAILPLPRLPAGQLPAEVHPVASPRAQEHHRHNLRCMTRIQRYLRPGPSLTHFSTASAPISHANPADGANANPLLCRGQMRNQAAVSRSSGPCEYS